MPEEPLNIVVYITDNDLHYDREYNNYKNRHIGAFHIWEEEGSVYLKRTVDVVFTEHPSWGKKIKLTTLNISWMLREHKFLDDVEQSELFHTTIVIYTGCLGPPPSEIDINREEDLDVDTQLCRHFPTWVDIQQYDEHPSVAQFVEIVKNFFDLY